MPDHLLFGAASGDLLVFAAAAVVVLLTGAAACWWPSRTASRVDPMVALRAE